MSVEVTRPDDPRFNLDLTPPAPVHEVVDVGTPIEVAVDNLRTGLSAETASRTSADDAERSARVEGDQTEATARADADAAEATARADADAAEVAARTQAISDEAAARIAGDDAEAATRAQAITDEQNARTQAITNEQSARSAAIALEKSQRESADSSEAAARSAGDAAARDYADTQVAAEASARAADRVAVQTALDAESAARQQADTAEVTARSQAISNEIAARNAAIAVETTARTNAVNSVKSDLAAETGARKNADAAIQSQIDSNLATKSSVAAETTARQNADAALQTSLNDEVGHRTTADSALQSQIDSLRSGTNQYADDGLATEAAARTAADDAESAARQDADDTLTGKVADETSARIAADDAETTARVNAIAAEQAARIDADATLQTNIDDEATSRTASDSALGGRIDQEVSDRQTAITSEATARDAAIASETSARQAADSTLTTSVQSAQATADAAIPQAQRGAPSGVASLDSAGLIPTAQLPPIATVETYPVASETAMLALSAQKGDLAIRSDLVPAETFILAHEDPTVLSNWVEITTPGAVTAVNGYTGNILLTNTDVGAPSTAQLSAETTARQNADTSLQTNIDAVATDLSTETSNRSSADTTLTNNLNAEVSTRSALSDLVNKIIAGTQTLSALNVSGTVSLPNGSLAVATTSGLQAALDGKYSPSNPPPAVDLSDYVTLDTTQTITGAKTFTGIVTSPRFVASTPDIGGSAAADIGSGTQHFYIRPRSGGGIEFLDSAYSAVVTSVSDGGDLTAAGTISDASGLVYSPGNAPPYPVTSVNGRAGSVTGLAEDSSVVHLTGSETVAGAKTFSVAPAVPDGAWSISKTTNLQSTLDSKYSASNPPPATDLSGYVTLVTEQTIGATKTFTVSPVVPDSSWSIAKTTGLQTALDSKYSPTNSNLSSTTPSVVTAVGAAGTGTSYARADHAHAGYSVTNANLASTVSSATAFAIAAAVGTSTVYARADHTHGTPATPVTGLTGGAGIGVSASTGAVTLSNTGVLALSSGTATSVQNLGGGTWRVHNTGVTSLAGRTGAVSLSAADIGAGTFAQGIYTINGGLTVSTVNTTTVPLSVKGFTGQSANLQEWQNSSGVTLSSISSWGGATFPGIDVLGSQNWKNSDGTTLATIGTTGNIVGYNGASFYNSGPSGSTPLYVENSGDQVTAKFYAPATNTADLFQVQVGTNKPFRIQADGSLRLALTADAIGFVVKGVLSQSWDLQQWQNSSGTVLSHVDKDGQWIGDLSGGAFGSSSLLSGTGGWGATLGVRPIGNVNSIGLVVKGMASQAGNLAEFQNSSGGVLAYVGANGDFACGGGLSSGIAITAVSGSPPVKGLVVKGAVSQTANLAEFQNSSGTVVASVSPSGRGTFDGVTLTNTLNFASINDVGMTGSAIAGYVQVFVGGTLRKLAYYS